MAGRDGDVLHPSCLGQSDPCLGVKLLRIKKLRQAVVFIERQLAVMKDPFTSAKDAVYTPVDKHSEFCILELPARLHILRSGLVFGLGSNVAVCEDTAACQGDG